MSEYRSNVGAGWSADSYTAPELAQMFSRQALPRYLLVQDGFYLEDSPDLSVSQGDVLELHGVRVQQCVLAQRLGDNRGRGKDLDGEVRSVPLTYSGKGYVKPMYGYYKYTWQLARADPRPRFAVAKARHLSPTVKKSTPPPVPAGEVFEILGEVTLGSGTKPILQCRLVDKDKKTLVYIPMDYRGDFEVVMGKETRLYTVKEIIQKVPCPVCFHFVRPEVQDCEAGSTTSGHCGSSCVGDFMLKELTDVEQFICCPLQVGETGDQGVVTKGAVFLIPTQEGQHEASFRFAYELPGCMSSVRRRVQVNWTRLSQILENCWTDQHKVQGIESNCLYENMSKQRRSRKALPEEHVPAPSPCVPPQPGPRIPRLRSGSLPAPLPETRRPPALAPKPTVNRRSVSDRGHPFASRAARVQKKHPPSVEVRPMVSPDVTSLKTPSSPLSRSTDSLLDEIKTRQQNTESHRHTKEIGTKDDMYATQLSEIPEDLRELSVQHLSRILGLMRLPDVAATCERRLVDGTIFMELEEEDFRSDPFFLQGLALKTVLHLQKRGWRPKLMREQ